MHIDKYLDMEQLASLKDYISEEMKEAIRDIQLSHRELTVVVRLRDLEKFLTFLRDDRDCQFKMLVDLCGADYPERTERFEVVYHLLSLTQNARIRVKVSVAEGQSVPSMIEVFPNANWYERETYDMFGITFEDHPDLRRILTDYDFDGFPLRKDFPVEGKVEMFYDETLKRCVYRPTDLKQPYRHFDWQSPWKAMDDPYSLAEEDNTFDRGEFAASEPLAAASGEDE